MPDIAVPATQMGVFQGALDRWEAVPVAMLIDLLRPDDVVLDAGTGAGATALASAKIACRVITCDPHPDVAAWLGSASLPVNVEFRHCALTVGVDSEVAFFFNSEFWNSALDGTGNIHGEFAEAVPVSAADVRAIIADAAVTVVALDVEGAEVQLLPAIASCPSVRAILVEFHPYKQSLPFALQGFRIVKQVADDPVLQVLYERDSKE